MVPLLDGIKAQHNVLLRGDLYNAVWQPQQKIIDVSARLFSDPHG